jgi:hypothetical protein
MRAAELGLTAAAMAALEDLLRHRTRSCISPATPRWPPCRRASGVTARSLAGGPFLRLGHVVRDLLGWRLLGHLIRGLAGVGTGGHIAPLPTRTSEWETLLR